MIRAVGLIALIATPALAEEPLTMEFRNESHRPANISGIFELRPDGTSVDDNLGSSDVFGPGQTVTVQTALIRCMTVEIWAFLGPIDEPNREEIRGETDLCKNRVMILHD